MGSKAQRTAALSVAGIALAGGASLALAAPASAAAPAGADFSSFSSSEFHAAGSITSTVSWSAQGSEKSYSAGHSSCSDDCDDPGCNTGCSSNCSSNCSGGCDNGCDDPGYRGGYQWQGQRVVGFYRSYQQARLAALRGHQQGRWDGYNCDFTKRGYRGWHASWNKWGANDWRCKGAWVVYASC
jgi:hypothetical protein